MREAGQPLCEVEVGVEPHELRAPPAQREHLDEERREEARRKTVAVVLRLANRLKVDMLTAREDAARHEHLHGACVTAFERVSSLKRSKSFVNCKFCTRQPIRRLTVEPLLFEAMT